MAVNPLDPSRPVLADPVEITEELRAIKQRLVTDKANIESVQNTVIELTDPGVFGLAMLSTENLSEAMDLLEAGTAGINVFTADTLLAIQTYLGITSPNATVSAGAGKTCVTFAGGVKINCNMGTFSDESSHTFQTPFATTVFAVVCTMNQNENTSAQVYSINNSGFSISFEGSGTKACSVIAIGI